MKIATVFCGIALFVIVDGSFAASSGPRDDAAAKSAATDWLKLVDAGNYGESWTAAAARFRQNISKEEWQSKVARVRSPLGALRSRTLQSVAFKSQLPGAPDGEYVVLR